VDSIYYFKLFIIKALDTKRYPVNSKVETSHLTIQLMLSWFASRLSLVHLL